MIIDEEFKMVGDFWVNIIMVCQWGYFCWIFCNKGWLNQMCFCYFFEDFGNDMVQILVFFNVDVDRFSNCFCRVEVVQICYVGFWVIFFDCFMYGQFFEWFIEVQCYVVVGYFCFIENILCQSMEQ